MDLGVYGFNREESERSREIFNNAPRRGSERDFGSIRANFQDYEDIDLINPTPGQI